MPSLPLASTFAHQTHEILEQILATLGQQNPIWLFLAIALLPGFGCPSSPLFILAGMTWGTGWQGCSLALAATALNLGWTYWAAARPGHALASKMLGARTQKWRESANGNPKRLIAIIRLTPGIPLCIQNYALGFLAVPFRSYMAISFPISGIFVTGFVMTGGALLQGKTSLIIGGIALILIASVGINLIRKKFRVDATTTEPSP